MPVSIDQLKAMGRYSRFSPAKQEEAEKLFTDLQDSAGLKVDAQNEIRLNKYDSAVFYLVCDALGIKY